MFDINVSLSQTISLAEFLIPFWVALGMFIVWRLAFRESIKNGTHKPGTPVLVMSAVTLLFAFSLFDAATHAKRSANLTVQTLNTIQIEASDLGLPVKEYIAEVTERFPEDHPEGFFEGIGAYKFLGEADAKKIRFRHYLTQEEYLVASQYIRHCYPGPEGELARDYMASYPVEAQIVSKKLVKAQSLTSDEDIQKDCLNSVSLTFLQ